MQTPCTLAKLKWPLVVGGPIQGWPHFNVLHSLYYTFLSLQSTLIRYEQETELLKAFKFYQVEILESIEKIDYLLSK